MAKKTSPKQTPDSNVSTAKIDFSRNELNLLLPAYFTIRDVIEGEMAVKGIVSSSTGFLAPAGNGGIPSIFTNMVLTRATRYLPQPNASDKSQENIDRYRSYVQRAQFYNVTSRTLEGLTGQIFLRDPDVTLPPQLDLLKIDANGGGLTLDQVANRMVRNCISYSRGGLLVDYPTTNGAVTKAQAENGIRPVLLTFFPWDIINWRVELLNAQKVLTMVVLREVLDETAEDGFQLNAYEQYRVLTLEDGVHRARVFRKEQSGNSVGNFNQTAETFPTDAKGKPLTAIPFTFFGAENNDSAPNKPLLYDLASLNIGHYRNSADYEEACFMAGQPTPVFTGLTQDWVENVLKGSITLGSRAAIPLPVGAKAELLQAQANSMPFEAMKAKEQQMVALGAKLVQIQKTSKTATQQIIETTSESSPLSNCSKNVSAAIEYGLKIAAQFTGADPNQVSYKLNKDFDLTSMTADDQNAVVLQWQSAAISYSEMRTVLRRAGTATLGDKEARTEIKQDIADGMIPDPAQSAQPQSRAPLPNAPSDAGGPQPKRPRRQPSPGTTA